MYSKAMIRQIHAGVSSIGLALNLLAIFLILKNKHSVVGRYAYLLFCFSIINLVYVLVDLLFAPANIVSGHTFMLVNLSVSLPTPWLNYIPVILYCVLCCQTLVFLMFQFVYRYAQPELNPDLWVGYLGTFLVIGMLASIWMVIIYSGYNVYNALSTARIDLILPYLLLPERHRKPSVLQSKRQILPTNQSELD
ncbi:unnamed protein product, partial [Mesorhabditis spiculigera]